MSKTEFKAHALEVLRKIEASGEPIIITNHGKPTLEIRKLSNDNNDPFKMLKDSIVYYSDPFEPVSENDWDVMNDRT